MKTGIELIAEERQRRIAVEGETLEYDAKRTHFELTKAAISYAEAVASPDDYAAAHGNLPAPTSEWPWAMKWWKPSRDPVRNLVKAGALIAAEIDRLQRAAPPAEKESP